MIVALCCLALVAVLIAWCSYDAIHLIQHVDEDTP